MSTGMLRYALFLARMDVRHMFRARETWLWAFIMPVMFFYFIGMMTGGQGRHVRMADPIAVNVGPDAGFLADALLARLQARDYRIVRPDNAKEYGECARRLTIPAGFTASVLARKPVRVELERRGAGNAADYDQVRVARAVYGTLADLIVIAENGSAATPAAFDEMAKRPRLAGLSVRPAGKLREVPIGFQQSVPGSMVMFTLLVLFTTGGVTIVIERKQGILRRLASSPAPRGAVALGKWGARMTLGTIQIAFAMLAGSLLFHIRWGEHLAAVAAVLLSYGALAAALSLLLGNLSRTEGQVIGAGVLASNVMAALGGCWWPIEVTPRWAQSLALVFPTGWAMDALHKLVSFGAAPAAVLPHLAAMIAAAVVAGWFAARTFRFQ